MAKTAVWLAVIAIATGCSERGATYVSSFECASCHPAEWRRWQGSDHDLAMEEPTPAAVRGDFSGVELQTDARWARFRRDGADYWIDVREGGAATRSHRVRYTFGVDPLQQYLLEFPGGRLQPFPIAWDTSRGVWFEPPSEGLHWTGRYQSWNSMCADCHSTGVRKNYDPAGDSFQTTFEELDVGCQSCHGPGSRHVEWARQPEPSGDRGLVLSARDAEVEACAACHSHRSRLTPEPIAGEGFFDQFRPSTLREGLYFDDGQIRDEVFEYGSFVQSRMFARGVRCSNCHDPHGLKTLPGNLVCTQCHQTQDDRAHHHHPPASEGARCVSCHMPARTYMGVDARRDHSLRIPRPDLSLEIGTPNACTQSCHLGRGDRWAAEAVAEWFPTSKPAHYGEIIHRARRGADVRAELSALARSATEPAIVRATALELLAGDPRACEELRRDPSPQVREAALACAERLPPAEREQWARAALDDPSRLVRLEAARLLGLSTPEVEAQLRVDLDRPEGWFQRAIAAENAGRIEDASRDYRRAIELDARFRPAIFNLAQLQMRRGSTAEAEATLLAAVGAMPEDGELWYALGLARAERGRFADAAAALARAAELLPGRADVLRNLAIVGRAAGARGRQQEGEQRER